LNGENTEVADTFNYLRIISESTRVWNKQKAAQN